MIQHGGSQSGGDRTSPLRKNSGLNNAPVPEQNGEHKNSPAAHIDRTTTEKTRTIHVM